MRLLRYLRLSLAAVALIASLASSAKVAQADQTPSSGSSQAIPEPGANSAMAGADGAQPVSAADAASPTAGLSPAPGDQQPSIGSPSSSGPPSSNEPPSSSGAAGGEGGLAPVSGVPSGGNPGAEGGEVSESNTTTQSIRQIQISGCTEHCQGTSETQLAEQQNVTVQTVAAAPSSAVSSPGANPPQGVSAAPLISPGPARGGASGGQGGVSQIQLGCTSHCFGTTTVTSPAAAASAQGVIEQLLGRFTLPGPPTLSPAPATEQVVVEQSGYQLQAGGPSTITQEQVSIQSNATAQTSTQASVSDVVDQLAQGIWQLQIGCIFYCTGTTMSQQAVQSDTTQLMVPSLTPGSAATRTSGLGETSQVIWQLQIGCISWCYDATELQSASSEQSTTAVSVSPPPVAGPPPAPGGPSPDAGTPQTPATPPTTGQPPPVGVAGSDLGAGGTRPPDASTVSGGAGPTVGAPAVSIVGAPAVSVPRTPGLPKVRRPAASMFSGTAVSLAAEVDGESLKARTSSTSRLGPSAQISGRLTAPSVARVRAVSSPRVLGGRARAGLIALVLPKLRLPISTIAAAGASGPVSADPIPGLVILIAVALWWTRLSPGRSSRTMAPHPGTTGNLPAER
jgi:hypothetical protein